MPANVEHSDIEQEVTQNSNDNFYLQTQELLWTLRRINNKQLLPSHIVVILMKAKRERRH